MYDYIITIIRQNIVTRPFMGLLKRLDQGIRANITGAY